MDKKSGGFPALAQPWVEEGAYKRILPAHPHNTHAGGITNLKQIQRRQDAGGALCALKPCRY